MFKHLLVPIDGSRLSSRTVDQAVAFARSSSAKVTFLHARLDFAATGDGALLHAMAPAAFAEAAAGNARVLLAKAEAAARAAGVRAESVVCTNDRPHEVILDTAQQAGCDLIFMASHGRRGLAGALVGSVTNRVLQRAKVPVLVSAVESNLHLDDEQLALATIRDEHRSLAAVMHAMGTALERPLPDLKLLGAMLWYIEQFPQRLHHPKEEAFLFVKLRQRTSECDALLAGLEQHHTDGAKCFAELGRLLDELGAGRPGAHEALAGAVQSFQASQWQHMSTEERVLLPAASRHLLAADWAEIARAFDDNQDPRFANDADSASFDKLAARLLNMAAAGQVAATETTP